ncbi:MAG: hypothetical protein ABGW69_02255 [Nanoarchaeota archaeon]
MEFPVSRGYEIELIAFKKIKDKDNSPFDIGIEIVEFDFVFYNLIDRVNSKIKQYCHKVESEHQFNEPNLFDSEGNHYSSYGIEVISYPYRKISFITNKLISTIQETSSLLNKEGFVLSNDFKDSSILSQYLEFSSHYIANHYHFNIGDLKKLQPKLLERLILFFNHSFNVELLKNWYGRDYYLYTSPTFIYSLEEAHNLISKIKNSKLNIVSIKNNGKTLELRGFISPFYYSKEAEVISEIVETTDSQLTTLISGIAETNNSDLLIDSNKKLYYLIKEFIKWRKNLEEKFKNR